LVCENSETDLGCGSGTLNPVSEQFKKDDFRTKKKTPQEMGCFLFPEIDKISPFCYDSCMMIPKKILSFLEKSGVKSEIIDHRKVYTAIDKARTMRAKDGSVAKTVVLKADRQPFIALTGADSMLNLDKLKRLFESGFGKKVKKIGFANEKWIKENLKGMKQGVIPPFGAIWNLPVFADRSLMLNSKIFVNSGSQTQSIILTPAALRKLVPELREGLFSKKRAKRKKQ